MRKLSGFSLMEMMVVLLIVAIVAAASAPMVSKKLSSASSAAGIGCLWKTHDDDKFSVTYNSIAKPNKSVIIGAKKTDEAMSSNEKPRLFVKTNNDSNPQIRLYSNANGASAKADLAVTSKNTYWFSSADSSQTGPNSVAIGNEATVGSCIGAIAIGADANVSSSGGSVAIGSAFSAGAFSGGGAQAGQTSVAIGSSSNAKNYAVAVGYGAKAKENYSTAVGNIAEATNLYSAAFGRNARALEDCSTAVGSNSTAKSHKSSAFGHYAAAIAENAIAIGTATASAFSSIAIGSGSKAESNSAIAIGGVAGGSSSIAIGSGANVDKEYATALGFSAKASGESSVALGDSAKVGDGAQASIAIGCDAKVSQVAGIAIGRGTNAEGKKSIAIGSGASASGDNGIAIGTVSAGYNEVKLGTDSHKVYLGGCTFKSGVADIDVLRVKQLYVDQIANMGELSVKSLSVYNDAVFGTSYNGSPRVYVKGDFVVDGHSIISRKTGSKAFYRLYNEKTKKFDTLVNLNTKDGDENQGKAHIGGGYAGSEGYSFDGSFNALGESDRRLKNVGEVFTAGLEEIKKLEVFNYVYKKDSTKTPHVGVMAQDLMKIFPNAVFKGDDGFYRIRMEDMFYALVNAVKELDKKIDLLAEKQKEIDTLRAEVKSLKKDYADLEKRIEQLEKRK